MGDRRGDNTRFFHRIQRGGACAAPWVKGNLSGWSRLNAAANRLFYKGWMFSLAPRSSGFDLKVFYHDPGPNGGVLRVGTCWPVESDASPEELLEVARRAVDAIDGPEAGALVQLRPG
jgi:hypothetical protein